MLEWAETEKCRLALGSWISWVFSLNSASQNTWGVLSWYPTVVRTLLEPDLNDFYNFGDVEFITALLKDVFRRFCNIFLPNMWLGLWDVIKPTI